MERLLRTAVCTLAAVAAVWAAPRLDQNDEARIRESVSKTLALFEKTGNDWKVPCVSCHHQGLTMMAQDAARRHGVAVNETAARAHAAKTMNIMSSAESAALIGFDAFGLGYIMMAADAERIGPTLATAAVARRFLYSQRPDGEWPPNDSRPPHSYSAFASTALGARVIALYLPGPMAAQREASLMLAREWLASHDGKSSEDRSFRLLGMMWAGASSEQQFKAIHDLLSHQRKDGGWAQEDGMESDAYATGEALTALRRAGAIATADAAWKRGAAYLLKMQYADGSWLVKTRLHSPAPIGPPFIETGFPHGHDQIISLAASAWAVMALLEALPKVIDPVNPLPVPEALPKGVQPWMQAAIAGSVEELRALLNTGLDPNSATEEGTTLLMLASPDLEKMKLLLERGAKVNGLSKGGSTALTVAASYTDSLPAVELLLASGAAVNPQGVRPDGTSFDSAVMGGNPKVVSLLLAKGAAMNTADAPQTSALISAAGSGNVEMVRLLVQHGADPNEVDDHKMTPLMWAAMAHKNGTIRALLELGADPDRVDQYGYTALRHTGDIWDSDPTTADLFKQLRTKGRVHGYTHSL